MTDQSQQDREAFEKWSGLGGGDYKSRTYIAAWRGWQAALAYERGKNGEEIRHLRKIIDDYEWNCKECTLVEDKRVRCETCLKTKQLKPMNLEDL